MESAAPRHPRQQQVRALTGHCTLAGACWGPGLLQSEYAGSTTRQAHAAHPGCHSWYDLKETVVLITELNLDTCLLQVFFLILHCNCSAAYLIVCNDIRNYIIV